MKALYYELQLLEHNAPKKRGKLIGCLKKLESELGANQDLAMLKNVLRKKSNKFGAAARVDEIMECLDRKSKKLKEKSRVLGEAAFGKER